MLNKDFSTSHVSDFLICQFLFFVYNYSGGRVWEGVNEQGIEFYNKIINETIANGDDSLFSS